MKRIFHLTQMSRILFFFILLVTAFTACRKDKKNGAADPALTGTWILSEYIYLVDEPGNYTFNADRTYSIAPGNTVGESGIYKVKTTADPRIVELSLTKNGGGSYLLTIEKLSERGIRIKTARRSRGFYFNRR